jgi:tRNA pseudouridine38-40 synthase
MQNKSSRLKLIVAYDGSAFSGWQSQAHRNTVQDCLESAIARITGTKSRVHGAGRTDAGVHALAQCAHVDLPNNRIQSTRWPAALNAVLPPALRVLRCQYVSQNFHARFSAKGKTYSFRLWTASVLPPLEFNRAWHIPHPFDFWTLKSATSEFVGTHDFAAFAANRGKAEQTTVRTIRSITVSRQGPCIRLVFQGEGFLYKMVRLMTGAIVKCAQGKLALEAIRSQIKSGRVPARRFLAAAEGLYLVRVRY